MFKDPMERLEKVEELAEKWLEKIEREDPEFVRRCGRDNLLSDLGMEVAKSLPLDEQTKVEMAASREQDIADTDEEAEDHAGTTTGGDGNSPGASQCLPENTGGEDTLDANGYAVLHRVTFAGNIQAIRMTLASGANPEIRDGRGWAPLHAAAGKGNAGATEALLEGGADPNIVAEEGQFTPLHLAVSKNHPDVVALLLRHGADPDAADGHGVTPLWEAADSANGPIAELLLAHGASVNLASVGGMTPLHAAVRQGQRDVVELLLKHGAAPECRDRLGFTPLDSALGKGRPDIIALLRAQGATSTHRITDLARAYQATAQATEQPDQRWCPTPGAVALADELKRDFDRLSKLGVTLAKGAWVAKMGGIGAGIAIGWRVNPLLGAAVAGTGFLAKGFAKGWKQIKIDEIRQKWHRILTGMGADDLREFAMTVQQRYPLLMDGLAMMLNPPGGPSGYLG